MRPADKIGENRVVRLWRILVGFYGWAEKNRTLIIQIVAVFCLMFFCVFIIPQAALGNHKIPLILIGGVIALPVLGLLMKFPSIHFVIMIPVAMLIPFGLGTGTGTSLNGAVLIILMALGLWILGMMIKKEIYLFQSRVVLPALLLALIAVISFLVGQLPWFLTSHTSMGAQIGGVLIFIITMGCLLVVANTLSPRSLEWMVWVFLGLATVFILARWQTNLVQSLANRFLNGAIGSVFWVWLLVLTLGQLFFNSNLKTRIRIWLGFLLALTLWVMLVQGREWTSGWLPPIFGAGVIIWIKWKKLRVPLILAGGFLLYLQWDSIRGLLLVGDNEYSLFTRLEAWKILFKIIAVNPITGVGPANYYAYTPLFPIVGYSVSFNSHSQYIDLLAQTGILGLGAFVWLMGSLQHLSIQIDKIVPPGFFRGFTTAAIGGVAGTILCGFLGDWVVPFVYNVGYEGLRASLIGWMFLGSICAIERWVRNKEIGVVG